MRAGVPDRGADAGARRRHDQCPTRQVDSVCPYCGVGCQLTYHVKDNTILYVQGTDGPANSSRLCVKGRYGFDYVQHKHRLTKPLIRKPGREEAQGLHGRSRQLARGVPRGDAGRRRSTFAAGGLRDIRDTHGRTALAGFGSAKGTNEEAYLFQKLVRTGFGSNNVDHCTRLCHASSVAALMEGINSGAVSNQVRDVDARPKSIFVIGANPTVEPSGGGDLDEERGRSAAAKLIVADPRRSRPRAARDLLPAVQGRHRRRAAERDAARHRRGRAGRRGVHPRSHVGLRGAARERRRSSRPEAMAPICGIDAQTHPRGRAAVRDVEGLDDPVGHGHLPARPRHRQRALPDRAGALDRPDREARHRAASAARPEQRAGRLRFRADPDVLSRLSARGRRRKRGSASRQLWGTAARSASRASPWSRS